MRPSQKPVATWLMIGVIMIIVQIILGGITRLTGSGLSITEWNVVTGTMPPMNQQAWMEAFDKYRQTEQFRQLNAGFTLQDFKFIFFWEWFHRLWGRLIGIVFIIPFLIFLFQKRFKPFMVRPLLVLFLLGALQGAVGWIMVASGLTGDAIYVRPAKLAMHFVLAMFLLFYTYWFALQLRTDKNSRFFNPAVRNFTWVILVVVFLQFFWAALMAGHRAAVVAHTWPDMNGSFIPPAVFNRPEGWISIIENPLVVHFIHRMLAYLLVILVIAWTFLVAKLPGPPAFRKLCFFPLVIVLIQTTLGILTVISSIRIRAYRWNEFEWMAQLHQLGGMLLLLSLVHVLFLSSKKHHSAS
ncbi:MAG: COX15/CtaA family protein [Flavisolibacter sp.]|jgi:cytochrome c oxidase assembly protein subunit 15|nr:COX15/CtaA family protein [Flavisolibacter sp.]